MHEKNTFETIEHDILHIKDYFHNYKFSYIERATKQHFYEKLREKNFSEEKIIEILNRSKSQLVEVKKTSKDAGAVIKEYSAKIFDLENEIKANEEMVSNEIKKLAQLEAEVSYLEEKSQGILKQESLNEELRVACDELQELIREIETKKQNISKIGTKYLRDEVNNLKLHKEKLCIRERRWSKIAMESNIDDLYCWYNKGTELLEKITGYRIMGYEVIGNKIVVRFMTQELEIEVLINEGRFVDARVLRGIELNSFNRIKDYALKIDDVRFLLTTFLFSLEK